MITQFLRWMSDEGLINPDDITKDNPDGFHTRFRIQKCMFVAQHLGLYAGYEYTKYRYGPYSPSLADDYYDFAEGKPDTSKEFDFANFAKITTCRDIMKHHDNDWLEIATILIHSSTSKTDRDSLIEYVEYIKYSYPKKYIESVFDDLLEMKLAGEVGELMH